MLTSISDTVRQLLDLFEEIPNTTDTQIAVTKSCIEWATSERRGFLRQNLETRLVTLYMAKQSYYEALTLINGLLRELKRLDAVSRSPIFAWFSESLNGLSTIRAFGQQKLFIENNERRVDRNQICYLPR